VQVPAFMKHFTAREVRTQMTVLDDLLEILSLNYSSEFHHS